MSTDLDSLTVTVRNSVRLVSSRTPDDHPDAAGVTTDESFNIDLSFGTGAAKADQKWVGEFTLAADGYNDHDLVGALENEFGQTINFANIKGVIVHNTSDDQGTPTIAALKVGGASSGAFYGPFEAQNDAINLPAGYVFMWYGDDTSGEGVTSGYGNEERFRVTNKSATLQASYKIIVFGESA
jgi:hypothetical protein